MAALTEQLVLSPPLAWARETQRKYKPRIVSYCGVGKGRNLVLSLCPGHVPLYCDIIFSDQLYLSYGSPILSTQKVCR